jgi:peptidoglycan/LPS O-acetylase OafA/YrhL
VPIIKLREVHLRALEGWRGVTALLVVLFHFSAVHTLFFHEWLRYLSPVLEFFFIVSGFVMALGFSEKVKNASTFWAFVVRRAGRVWPLHLTTLGLLLLIPLVRFFIGSPEIFSGSMTLESLPYQILILQTWWPDIALTWNYPAWTLTGEMFAYLLMALLVLVSTSERMRWVLGLLIIGVAGLFYYDAMLKTVNYNTISVSRAVTGFFVGFLLYHFWRAYPLRSRAIANVMEITTIIAFVGLLIWHPRGIAYFSVHVLFILVVYTYASDLGVVSRILFLPPFQWLGKKSFSMYMFHGVVTTWIMITARAIELRTGIQLTEIVLPPAHDHTRVISLPEQWMNDALTIGYIVIVLIGSAVLFRWVEDPSRVYFAKLSTRLLAPESRETIRQGARPQTSPRRII